uniref:Bifunctional inhibitor/plant lipid transfer protein/seed storage helical domain-containing protein n=1 Tax=Nicotiana tabacum TaxID=4097 RepID=A0A1S3YHU6_TOBAC|nr:PREDICTED: uncharacterized protein LOC107776177 [Nicotiana tabacum]
MSRGWVIFMFLIAAIVLCSHHTVAVENTAIYSQARTTLPNCSNSDKSKINKCMTNTTSIDKCCPLFKRTIGTNCKCYRYAKDLDNQALITLQAYCDVNNPCKRVQRVVAEAVATISATPRPLPRLQPKCSATDEAKVKKCMTNTTSMDACCPTFRSILGRSCPCFAYAMLLDNLALITIQAYCDVSNPCKQVQVI